MKENRVSNEFRQGREATFAALLMELCLCGERIASIMGIRNWYDQVGTVRIFLCILIFCYYYIIEIHLLHNLNYRYYKFNLHLQ